MKEFWHYISWILSEEDRQEIDVLMHLRDGAEFFRKAEEIAENCTVVKGQGFIQRWKYISFRVNDVVIKGRWKPSFYLLTSI